MRESCTSGSVRGARGNSRPYRNVQLRSFFAAVHESASGTKRRSEPVLSGSAYWRESGYQCCGAVMRAF
jgi:hypothetical protein